MRSHCILDNVQIPTFLCDYAMFDKRSGRVDDTAIHWRGAVVSINNYKSFMYDLLASASVTKTARFVSSILFMSAAIFGGFFIPVANATISDIDIVEPGSVSGQEHKFPLLIEWNATADPLDTVDIYYSTSDFITSTKLTASALAYNAGSYLWDPVVKPADGTTYKIRVQSTTNAIQGTSVNSFTLDNTDPSTAISIVRDGADVGSGTWYTKHPTITLTCTDATSGCRKIWYAWDSGLPVEFTPNGSGEVVVAFPSAAPGFDGMHTLRYYSDDQAIDESGDHNVEGENTVAINIDTITPTVAVTSTTGNGFYNEPDAINITLTFSEAVSSSNTLMVNLDSGGSCSVPILTNTTTGTCTYTVCAGQNSPDLTVTSIVPASGVVEDIAGNDSTLVPTSNLAATSAIVIDTTAPFPFAVGAVVTVGAPVVVGWWNSTNTGVNVVVPVDNTDLSLFGGTIQLTENNGGDPLNVGSAYTITAPDVVAGTKTLSLTAVEVEGVAGFVEGDTLTFSAIITDVASNGATGTASLNTFTVDQTAPVVNAGVDKEVKILTAQLATVTDTGGSGVAAYAWTKQAGSGIITFGTPAAEDTDVSASTDDTYTIRLTSTDVAGNSALDEATFVWDTTAPTLAEVTAIPTPANDATPSYTFSASHVGWLTGHTGGTVTYAGACGAGSVATAAAGNNTTTYTVAPNVTYTDCDIQVTDAAGNISSVLQVNDF